MPWILHCFAREIGSYEPLVACHFKQYFLPERFDHINYFASSGKLIQIICEKWTILSGDIWRSYTKFRQNSSKMPWKRMKCFRKEQLYSARSKTPFHVNKLVLCLWSWKPQKLHLLCLRFLKGLHLFSELLWDPFGWELNQITSKNR